MDKASSQARELRAAAIYGLLIAAAIDAGWLFTLFPYMDPNRWRWPIAILTCLIQTVFTTGGIVLAARLHQKVRVGLWAALPYGAAAGAVVGAISIGLAIGVRALLGMRVGMIEMVREAAWLNTAPAWRQFWEGCSAGLAFGAVGGYIPGAIGALALSIWRRWHTRKSPVEQPHT